MGLLSPLRIQRPRTGVKGMIESRAPRKRGLPLGTRFPVGPRFEKKVHKTDGCWFWTGAKTRDGYGVIIDGGVMKSAHRVAWELYRGPIPKQETTQHGCCVLHRCDNPCCVNPDHLFLGSQLDNIADAVAKGRNRNGSAKRFLAQCKRGHDLAGDNLHFRPDGRRECAQCQRIRSRNQRARQRELRAGRQ